MNSKEWAEWKDVLGNTYKPGDYVAVATIAGKSPQLVTGTVVRINKVDSKGNPVEVHTTDDGDLWLKDIWQNMSYGDPARQDAIRRWRATVQPIVTPSCTVTVLPSTRTYGSYHRADPKPFTYRIPANIIKVDKP